jgi:hypothetical protein
LHSLDGFISKDSSGTASASTLRAVKSAVTMINSFKSAKLTEKMNKMEKWKIKDLKIMQRNIPEGREQDSKSRNYTENKEVNKTVPTEKKNSIPNHINKFTHLQLSQPNPRLLKQE